MKFHLQLMLHLRISLLLVSALYMQSIVHVPCTHCTVIQWRLLTHSEKGCAGVCMYICVGRIMGNIIHILIISLSIPVAPGDYVDRDYRVVFDVATQRGTLNLMTDSDSILEDDELFMAVLSVPAGFPRVSEGSPSEAIVIIEDQTAAQVFFDPDLYPVLEGQVANLTLRLTVDVDLSITIIVMVQTMDGTSIGVYNRDT